MTDLAVGDFNNDFADDVVTSTSGAADTTDFSIFLSDGAGGYTRSDITGGSGHNVGSIAVGNFNADSNLDVVAIGGAVSSNIGQVIRVYTGDGAGGFTTQPDVTTTASQSEVAVGDFNGDGKDDVEVCYSQRF